MIGTIAASVIVIAMLAWGGAALRYKLSESRALARAGVVAWLAFGIATLLALGSAAAAPALSVFALASLSLLVWWWRLRPSNARIWNDDVARTTTGKVEASLLTIENVRNFDWRSRSEYTQRWETRTYDLDKLCSLDMLLSYWAGPAIAHTLVSFGFESAAGAGFEHLVFTVEIRRRRGQLFSQIGGFFKMYELSIVAATERDAIRVRTNVRGEDDLLFRVRMARPQMRSLLLAYIDAANGLVDAPRFYNTITANCTTIIYQMVARIVGRLPLNYRLLLSGYLPEYVYAIGGLDGRHTVPELRRLGRITERAQRADASDDFSAAIRAGIPSLDEPP
ncbi:MAG: DUF4105 domain-containing protein [Rudaea sp.]